MKDGVGQFLGNDISFYLLPVDEKDLVANFDDISRRSYNALDIIEALILRVHEDDDVASLWRASLPEIDGIMKHEVGKRQLEAIGELIDENMISDKKRRNHGSRWDLESLNDAGADHENKEKSEAEGGDILDNPAILRKKRSNALISEFSWIRDSFRHILNT